MKLACTLALLLALPASIPVLASDTVPASIRGAVSDKSRPAADTQRDEQRKPAETLAFAGVKPGNTVIELMPGGGYYTRLLSKVVGAKGHLYAVVPALRADAPPGTPDRSLPIKAIVAESGYDNINVLVQPIRTQQLPSGADLVWTSDNYHDLKNVQGLDLMVFNKSVFDALKPGGVYLIVDHAAAADAPADVTSTLHRIRVDTVKQDLLAVGFVLDAQSDILHNTTDAHNLPVFDEAVRGKTDQFILRFKKPKK